MSTKDALTFSTAGISDFWGQPQDSNGVQNVYGGPWVQPTATTATDAVKTQGPLALKAPFNNTSTEDALKQSYLNSMTPNYGFGFNNTNQANGNKFSSVATLQK